MSEEHDVTVINRESEWVCDKIWDYLFQFDETYNKEKGKVEWLSRKTGEELNISDVLGDMFKMEKLLNGKTPIMIDHINATNLREDLYRDNVSVKIPVMFVMGEERVMWRSEGEGDSGFTATVDALTKAVSYMSSDKGREYLVQIFKKENQFQYDVIGKVEDVLGLPRHTLRGKFEDEKVTQEEELITPLSKLLHSPDPESENLEK